jgi:hypothetical protein
VRAIALVALFGCSGGGNQAGGDILPLSVPSKMTVIAAQDADPASLPAIPEGTLASGLTDYRQDPTHVWVHDESLDTLTLVNEILCMLNQTGYQDQAVLNAGPYVALVDMALCESTGAEAGGETGASGSDARFMEWTVQSERASAEAPHIVRVWIDWEEDRGNGVETTRIHARLTIFESPSELLPYGRFTLHFKMLDVDEPHDSSRTIFQGTLSTVARGDGLAEYTFYERQGDIDAQPEPGEEFSLTRARIVTAADGGSGRAINERRCKHNADGEIREEASTYHIAFNRSHVARRKVAGADDVEVFDRHRFDLHPWRYGLYHAETQARVRLQSGFGIRTPSGARGYAGYHGIWLPDSVALTNGMQVTRDSFGQSGAPQVYTVFVAPGRLEKRTRTASTLGNLAHERLHGWDQAKQESMIVQWTGSDLLQTEVFSRTENRWVAVDPPTSLLGRYAPGQWVSFHSPARGEVNLVWPAGGLYDATEVSIWSVRAVDSDAPELAGGDLTLHAYSQMMRPNLTQSQVDWASGESPFFPDATQASEGKVYVFSRDRLVLTLGGQDVTMASGVNPTGPSAFGISGGPMITIPLTNLIEMSSQQVTYRWHTGPQGWNQLRTLRDGSGAFVRFDAPLELAYQHDEPANARFHGKVFRLEYHGHGQLHGIPHEQEPGTDRWYPVLAIPSGTLLSDGSASYLVKVLEAEQRMRPVADPQQVIEEQGLDLDTELSFPTETFQDPATGAKPTIDAPPLFVSGVKQTSGA